MKRYAVMAACLLMLVLAIYQFTPVSAQTSGFPWEFALNYQGGSDFDPSRLTDSELQQDLDLFASQKIRHITIIMYWNSMEPSEGSYSQTYLSRLHRFIDFCSARGFLMSMDSHCHMSGSGAPSWVANYGNGRRDMSNVFVEPTRTRFIELHEMLSQEFGDKLYSFQAWNEPQVQSSGLASDETNFIELFADLKTAWKSSSTSLFTIRTDIYGLRQLYNEPGFWNTLDYVNINFYPNRYSGHTFSNLRTCITRIAQQNLQWYFGEYGYDSDSDSVQYNGMQNILEDTKTELVGYQPPVLNQIWIWLRATSGGQWSFCDSNGNPRTAFSLLVNDELAPPPSPPPSPPPDDPDDPTPPPSPPPDDGTTGGLIPPYDFILPDTSGLPEEVLPSFGESVIFMAIGLLIVYAIANKGKIEI